MESSAESSWSGLLCRLGTTKFRSSSPRARPSTPACTGSWSRFDAAAAAAVLRQQTPARRQEPTRRMLVGGHKGPRSDECELNISGRGEQCGVLAAPLCFFLFKAQKNFCLKVRD